MKLFKTLLLIGATVAGLVGCGGGGGSPGAPLSGGAGTPTPTVPGPGTVSVSLADASGNAVSSSSFSAGDARTIRVLVRDGSSQPVAGAFVTVTASDTTIVSFSPTSGTAVTNASGVATVVITPASSSAAGAVQVTATAIFTPTGSTTQTTLTGTTAVTVVRSQALTANVSVVLADAAGAPTGTNTVSVAERRTLRVAVTDGSGRPIQNAFVSVAAATPNLVAFTPNSGTAVTDASGIALIGVAPASFAAAGAVQILAGASFTPAGSATPVSATGSIAIAVSAASVRVSNFVSAPANVQAFGSATLTGIVTGVADPSGLQVTLTSSCIAAGKASITPSPQTLTAAGAISATYTDRGCGGGTGVTDQVVATVTASGSTASVATTTLPVPIQAAAPFNIQFASASPAQIYIRGAGYTEQSSVKFLVVDQVGNPLPGVAVSLTLTTAAGDIRIDNRDINQLPVTKLSDPSGLVEAVVAAGTFPTPVRVIATIVSTGKSTQSNVLTITTGRPSQKFMSTSIETLNSEAFAIDNVRTRVQVMLADRLGNPVPDGTRVNFIVSGGGQITGSCTTASEASISRCSVEFASQGQRPRNGRVALLAYALGEETFTDDRVLNNIYDAGESFEDLGDVFLDSNLNGQHDRDEQSIPFAEGNSSACPPSSNEQALSRAGTCDGRWGQAYVRSNLSLVISDSFGRISDAPHPTNPAIAGTLTPPTVGCDQVRFWVIDVRDSNLFANNPMSRGTTVTALGTNITAEVTNGTVGNTLSPTRHVIKFSARACESGVPKDAVVEIRLTSPSGAVSSFGVNIPAP
jgi:hypothetical protein